MEKYLDRAGLSVAEPLARFIEDQALTGTGITAEAFWKGAAKIFVTLASENRALLWPEGLALLARIEPQFRDAGFTITLPWDRTFEAELDVRLTPKGP